MKRKVLRLVVSGESINELKFNMEEALAELNGEETTAAPTVQPAPRQTATPIPDAFLKPAVEALERYVSENPPAAPQPLNAGVDSMGLPWDERIHSSNMAKTKDGSWRIRRGVEPAFVKQVEHELIAKIKAGGAAEAPTFPPRGLPASPVLAPPTFVPPPPSAPPVVQALQPSAPVEHRLDPALANVIPPMMAPPLGNLTAPVHAALPPTVQPTAAPSTATPAAPPMPAVTSSHSLSTFTAQFVPTLAALVNDGKLTPEYVAALKTYFKLEQIYDANDQQKAEMFETFCKAGILTKVG